MKVPLLAFCVGALCWADRIRYEREQGELAKTLAEYTREAPSREETERYAKEALAKLDDRITYLRDEKADMVNVDYINRYTVAITALESMQKILRLEDGVELLCEDEYSQFMLPFIVDDFINKNLRLIKSDGEPGHFARKIEQGNFLVQIKCSADGTPDGTSDIFVRSGRTFYQLIEAPRSRPGMPQAADIMVPVYTAQLQR